MKHHMSSYTPSEPMTFREYCNARLKCIINDDDWLYDYDHYEERFFADYLSDMQAINYEPECGMDY